VASLDDTLFSKSCIRAIQMWYSYVSADLPTTTGQEDEVMGNSGGKGL
jgi:hypothetical protein